MLTKDGVFFIKAMLVLAVIGVSSCGVLIVVTLVSAAHQ